MLQRREVHKKFVGSFLVFATASLDQFNHRETNNVNISICPFTDACKPSSKQSRNNICYIYIHMCASSKVSLELKISPANLCGDGFWSGFPLLESLLGLWPVVSDHHGAITISNLLTCLYMRIWTLYAHIHTYIVIKEVCDMWSYETKQPNNFIFLACLCKQQRRCFRSQAAGEPVNLLNTPILGGQNTSVALCAAQRHPINPPNPRFPFVGVTWTCNMNLPPCKRDPRESSNGTPAAFHHASNHLKPNMNTVDRSSGNRYNIIHKQYNSWAMLSHRAQSSRLN